MKYTGILLTFLGMATFASAVPGVPEIDGSSVVSGVTLIAGVLLVTRASLKK